MVEHIIMSSAVVLTLSVTNGKTTSQQTDRHTDPDKVIPLSRTATHKWYSVLQKNLTHAEKNLSHAMTLILEGPYKKAAK